MIASDHAQKSQLGKFETQKELDETLRRVEEMSQSVTAARNETASDIAEFQSYIEEVKSTMRLDGSSLVQVPTLSFAGAAENSATVLPETNVTPVRPSSSQDTSKWSVRNGRMTLRLGPLPAHSRSSKFSKSTSSLNKRRRKRQQGQIKLNKPMWEW